MKELVYILLFITSCINYALAQQDPFVPPSENIVVADVTELTDAKMEQQIKQQKTKQVQENVLSDNNIKTVKSTTPSLEAKINDWYIMTAIIKGRRICYMIKYPDELIGNHKESRRPYMMISFVNNRRYEVSVAAGYKYRGNSIATMSIDGTIFKLTANNNIAWSQGVFDDFAIIHTMLSSFRVMVKSESSVGTYAVDTYDLGSFKEAYHKMMTICAK